MCNYTRSGSRVKGHKVKGQSSGLTASMASRMALRQSSSLLEKFMEAPWAMAHSTPGMSHARALLYRNCNGMSRVMSTCVQSINWGVKMF